MTTKLEYAALSAFVYNDQRGGGAGSNVNKLDLPSGWVELSTANGFTTGTNLNANPYSFTGGAYVNQSTGDIVVAYKGTDFLVELSGRAWNTVADLVADASLAIARKGLGTYNLQQLAASSYFLAVKDWAAQNGYDGNKISFTGHSLGGGLASNMAIWFGRPATTFAEAPFEASTVNPAAIVAAAATLTLQAGVTASAAVLAEIGNLSALATTPGTFVSRESAVTNYYNEGEFLQYLRAFMPTVVGTDTAIDIGSQSVKNALALHSMNLHAAFIYDDRLRQLAKDIPELVAALIDTKLHAADPNTNTKDLMTYLVNDQLRQGFANDSALKRFTTDIDKLKGADGITAGAAWRKALIAVASDYHYNADPATSTTLFTSQSGALHFDINRIDSNSLKALPLLRTAISSTVTGGDPFNLQNVTGATHWHVQSGAGVMNWLANIDANDAAVGGVQGDFLRAGKGEDYLVGGLGADLLDGGEGNDMLLGGDGADIYEFSATFGNDVIVGSDSAGLIKVDNTTLNGGKKVDDNVWESADGVYRYQLFSFGAGQDLVIGRGSKAEANQMQGSIVIKGWTGTGLGLTLSTAMVPVPAGIKNYNGDQRGPLAGSEPDTYYNWGVTTWAPDGSLTGGVAEANFADVIYGVSVRDDGDDLIAGGAGSDNISGGVGISTFLPQMEYGNTLVSHPLIHTTKYSLATIASFETKYLWRRCKMIERVKINSSSSKYHESRCHISIKNRLRRS